jgi:hypothetical protein
MTLKIAEPTFGRTRTGEQGSKKQKFRSMLRNFGARRRDGADGLGYLSGREKFALLSAQLRIFVAQSARAA